MEQSDENAFSNERMDLLKEHIKVNRSEGKKLEKDLAKMISKLGH